MTSNSYNAAVQSINFVVHRIRPAHYHLQNLSNPGNCILVLTESGRAAYECQGARQEARAGSLFFFLPGLPHSVRSDPADPWSFFSVGFKLCGPDASMEDFQALPWHVHPPVNERLLADFSRLERLWLTQPPGYLLAVRGLALQLLYEYLAAAVCQRPVVQPHARTIRRLIDELQQDPTRTVGVSELARRAGLSPSRFRHLFALHTGCGVTKFQNRLRLRAAQSLLLGGHCNVSEAARQTGFTDLYYFSRLFKQELGCPPSRCHRP